MLEIRKATDEDKSEVWEIIKAVIATGDTYVFYPDTPKEKMLAYWFAADKQTYVAVWSDPPALAGGSSASVAPVDAPGNYPVATASGSDNFAPSGGLSGKIVGTFFLKDNQPDLGSHIANAGYMVSPQAKGKGVGRAMAEFSLEEARRLGYRAMQFNFVVKTNEMAVRLWLALGFEIIGEIPEAFNHAEKGLANAYIMYRQL
jgi:ribosomal protein S18 acetylase RimI-like enzyme